MIGTPSSSVGLCAHVHLQHACIYVVCFLAFTLGARGADSVVNSPSLAATANYDAECAGLEELCSPTGGLLQSSLNVRPEVPLCFPMTWNAVGTHDVELTVASTEDQCRIACHGVHNCRAGVWDNNRLACRLAAGNVSVRMQAPGDNITSCWMRPNEERASNYNCNSAGAACSDRIGAVHWNPCYSVNNTLPVLLEGAQVVSSMGSKVIKVALLTPHSNYPHNSPEWPDQYNYYSLHELAKHPYYRALWDMDFDTFVLIAYSKNVSELERSDHYFRDVMLPEDEAHEADEFAAASAFFLRQYPNKTFIFENWEGDWAIRKSTEDWDTAPEDMFARMGQWVAARQKGVTTARDKFKELGSTGNVYLSLEVNLVLDALELDRPNLMNRVVPNVATDMISYSAYDSQFNMDDFRKALNYIKKTHKRTAHSPPGAKAIFIAEYGVPYQQAPLELAEATVSNVVNTALEFGVGSVLYWVTYDNECIGGPGCNEHRCSADVSLAQDQLRGWWLVDPRGKPSWTYNYLHSKISGGDVS